MYDRLDVQSMFEIIFVC